MIVRLMVRNILKKYQNKIDKLIFHKKILAKDLPIRSSQKFIRGDYVIIQDADLEYNQQITNLC